VLQALIEDFVMRHATDYGWVEMSMQDKSNKKEQKWCGGNKI